MENDQRYRLVSYWFDINFYTKRCKNPKT